MSCEKCGREIKNYGIFLGGIRCANNCHRLSFYKFKIKYLKGAEDMVTIHNLGEKSATEVIDFVKRHLMKQNRKSVSEVGFCNYRGMNDTKCAAGCLIPDEDYKPSMERNLWKGLIEKYNFTDSHQKLIEELQNIHDSFEVSEWAEKIDALRLEFKEV